MSGGGYSGYGPVAFPTESILGKERPLFLGPRGWDIREYLCLLGVLAMLLSTVALSWVKVDVEFKGLILGASWLKGHYSFKVLENGALCALILVMLGLSLALLFLRKPWIWAGPFLSLGLLGCWGYYLFELSRKAYDALGFLDSLLELVRKGIPVIGPLVAELTRQAVLDSIKSVRPQAGLFVFLCGNLLLLVVSSLRLLRK